jgi:hypothetical protein
LSTPTGRSQRFAAPDAALPQIEWLDAVLCTNENRAS